MKTKNNALSEMIGAMILIFLLAAVAAIVLVSLIGFYPPTILPDTHVDIKNSTQGVNNIINITPMGGDILKPDEYKVLISYSDGNSKTLNATDPKLQTGDKTGDKTFSLGNTLTYSEDMTGTNRIIESAALIYHNPSDSSDTLIYQKGLINPPNQNVWVYAYGEPGQVCAEGKCAASPDGKLETSSDTITIETTTSVIDKIYYLYGHYDAETVIEDPKVKTIPIDNPLDLSSYLKKNDEITVVVVFKSAEPYNLKAFVTGSSGSDITAKCGKAETPSGSLSCSANISSDLWLNINNGDNCIKSIRYMKGINTADAVKTGGSNIPVSVQLPINLYPYYGDGKDLTVVVDLDDGTCKLRVYNPDGGTVRDLSNDNNDENIFKDSEQKAISCNQPKMSVTASTGYQIKEMRYLQYDSLYSDIEDNGIKIDEAAGKLEYSWQIPPKSQTCGNDYTLYVRFEKIQGESVFIRVINNCSYSINAIVGGNDYFLTAGDNSTIETTEGRNFNGTIKAGSSNKLGKIIYINSLESNAENVTHNNSKQTITDSFSKSTYSLTYNSVNTSRTYVIEAARFIKIFNNGPETITVSDNNIDDISIPAGGNRTILISNGDPFTPTISGETVREVISLAGTLADNPEDVINDPKKITSTYPGFSIPSVDTDYSLVINSGFRLRFFNNGTESIKVGNVSISPNKSADFSVAANGDFSRTITVDGDNYLGEILYVNSQKNTVAEVYSSNPSIECTAQDSNTYSYSYSNVNSDRSIVIEGAKKVRVYNSGSSNITVSGTEIAANGYHDFAVTIGKEFKPDISCTDRTIGNILYADGLKNNADEIIKGNPVLHSGAVGKETKTYNGFSILPVDRDYSVLINLEQIVRVFNTGSDPVKVANISIPVNGSYDFKVSYGEDYIKLLETISDKRTFADIYEKDVLYNSASEMKDPEINKNANGEYQYQYSLRNVRTDYSIALNFNHFVRVFNRGSSDIFVIEDYISGGSYSDFTVEDGSSFNPFLESLDRNFGEIYETVSLKNTSDNVISEDSSPDYGAFDKKEYTDYKISPVLSDWSVVINLVKKVTIYNNGEYNITVNGTTIPPFTEHEFSVIENNKWNPPVTTEGYLGELITVKGQAQDLPEDVLQATNQTIDTNSIGKKTYDGYTIEKVDDDYAVVIQPAYIIRVFNNGSDPITLNGDTIGPKGNDTFVSKERDFVAEFICNNERTFGDIYSVNSLKENATEVINDPERDFDPSYIGTQSFNYDGLKGVTTDYSLVLNLNQVVRVYNNGYENITVKNKVILPGGKEEFFVNENEDFNPTITCENDGILGTIFSVPSLVEKQEVIDSSDHLIDNGGIGETQYRGYVIPNVNSTWSVVINFARTVRTFYSGEGNITINDNVSISSKPGSYSDIRIVDGSPFSINITTEGQNILGDIFSLPVKNYFVHENGTEVINNLSHDVDKGGNGKSEYFYNKISSVNSDYLVAILQAYIIKFFNNGSQAITVNGTEVAPGENISLLVSNGVDFSTIIDSGEGKVFSDIISVNSLKETVNEVISDPQNVTSSEASGKSDYTYSISKVDSSKSVVLNLGQIVRVFNNGTDPIVVNKTDIPSGEYKDFTVPENGTFNPTITTTNGKILGEIYTSDTLVNTPEEVINNPHTVDDKGLGRDSYEYLITPVDKNHSMVVNFAHTVRVYAGGSDNITVNNTIVTAGSYFDFNVTDNGVFNPVINCSDNKVLGDILSVQNLSTVNEVKQNPNKKTDSDGKGKKSYNYILEPIDNDYTVVVLSGYTVRVFNSGEEGTTISDGTEIPSGEYRDFYVNFKNQFNLTAEPGSGNEIGNIYTLTDDISDTADIVINNSLSKTDPNAEGQKVQYEYVIPEVLSDTSIAVVFEVGSYKVRIYNAGVNGTVVSDGKTLLSPEDGEITDMLIKIPYGGDFSAVFSGTPDNYDIKDIKIINGLVDAETVNLNGTVIQPAHWLHDYTYVNSSISCDISMLVEFIPFYKITSIAGLGGFVTSDSGVLVSDSPEVRKYPEDATPTYRINTTSKNENWNGFSVTLRNRTFSLSVDDSPITLSSAQTWDYSYSFKPLKSDHTIKTKFAINGVKGNYWKDAYIKDYSATAQYADMRKYVTRNRGSGNYIENYAPVNEQIHPYIRFADLKGVEDHGQKWGFSSLDKTWPDTFGKVGKRDRSISTYDPYKRDFFYVNWTGYIYIEDEGTYTFYTRADDGAKLFIDGVDAYNEYDVNGHLVIWDQRAWERPNNGPQVDGRTITGWYPGTINPGKGWHTMTAWFYEYSEDCVMDLCYVKPGDPVVPPSNFGAKDSEYFKELYYLVD